MALPTTFSLQPGQRAPAGSKTIFPADITFTRVELLPDAPLQALSYTNAEKLASEINLPPGGRAYCFVNGSFIFGDFLEAFLVHHDYHVRRMIVTALSIKHENVDSLRNLLEGGYVDQLGLIVSDYNFAHGRYDLMPYVAEQLGYDGRWQDGRFAFAAVRNHSKICLLDTHCGRKLVLHGSANLVSSGNVEQFCIEDNPALYDFNHAYLAGLLRKYSVLHAGKDDIRQHKPLTKAQTWQPVPPSTAT